MMSMLTSLTLVSHYDLTLFFIASHPVWTWKEFQWNPCSGCGPGAVEVDLQWILHPEWIIPMSAPSKCPGQDYVKSFHTWPVQGQKIQECLFWCISVLKYSEKIH